MLTVKWWTAVAQWNCSTWQWSLAYIKRLCLLLCTGLIVSCASVDRDVAPVSDIEEAPPTASTQLYARSGLAAIVDLSPISASTAFPTGPQTIGYSVAGFPIESYSYGTGPKRIVFVGGIHGGTEWNTVLLAYAAIDYFDRHPEMVPPALTLQIVPSANPDGQRLVTGSWGRFLPENVGVAVAEGRFNQNGVDLNRNWGCAWSETAWWGNREISAGTAPFSEPETRALRDFFLSDGNPVQAVVFWHSAVPGVFAGGCAGIYAAAERLATIYAQAAGYPHGESFSYYPITGDATNWLSEQRIPAIIVELETRDDPEWPQNLDAMLAVLAYMAEGGEGDIHEIEAELTSPRQLAR